MKTRIERLREKLRNARIRENSTTVSEDSPTYEHVFPSETLRKLMAEELTAEAAS